MYSFQNSPEYWAAPDEFRPERFLPQRDGGGAGAASNPAFAPFGDVGCHRSAGVAGELLLQHEPQKLNHESFSRHLAVYDPFAFADV